MCRRRALTCSSCEAARRPRELSSAASMPALPALPGGGRATLPSRRPGARRQPGSDAASAHVAQITTAAEQHDLEVSVTGRIFVSRY